MAVQGLYGPERGGNEPEEGKQPIGWAERFLLVNGLGLTPRVRQWPRNKKPVGTQFT